jgi:hypothetical protein
MNTARVSAPIKTSNRPRARARGPKKGLLGRFPLGRAGRVPRAHGPLERPPRRQPAPSATLCEPRRVFLLSSRQISRFLLAALRPVFSKISQKCAPIRTPKPATARPKKVKNLAQGSPRFDRPNGCAERGAQGGAARVQRSQNYRICRVQKVQKRRGKFLRGVPAENFLVGEARPRPAMPCGFRTRLGPFSTFRASNSSLARPFCS